MAYPGPFGRLVATGTLFGTETFSFGFSLIPSGTGPYSLNAATNVVTCANLLKAYLATSLTATAVKLTTVKLNLVGPDGKYADPSGSVTYDLPTPGVGTGGLGVAPQVALAVTLTTANKRGLAHVGRFYHPAPSSDVASDGMIATAFAQQHANDAAKLVNDLNTTFLAQGFRVGVASDVREGKFLPVTGVKVGRVLDTIRSRRTKFGEAYVPAVTAIA
jgi:hypothetical protein